MKALFALFILIIAIPATAHAGQILQCGAPVSVTINTDPNVQFCDIYTRQLKYRDSLISLQEQLQERAKNYVAPGIEARKNYREALAALHESYGEEEEAEAKTKEDLDLEVSFK